MSLKIWQVLALSMVSFAAAQAAAPASPPVQVPMESFARLPAIRKVTLSPDGQFIAYSMFDDLQTAFAFKNLDTGWTKGVEGIAHFRAVNPEWVSNERVVYGYLAGINRDGGKYAGLLGYARQVDKRDQDQLNAGEILFRE
ncbi:MAG: hypothetical protein ABI222_12660, partial [Opitutaceae bacterium]